MESNKNNNQGAIIKAFVLMTAILGFIGGFVLSGDLKDIVYKASKTEEKEESKDIFTAASLGNKTLGFDEKYVMSDDDYSYEINFGTYAGSTDVYFTLNYGDSKKDLTVTKYTYDSEETQEHTLQFVSDVVDIYSGQFNDNPLDNSIFYLLSNGDVCYSLIEDMVKSDSYGTYNTINELKNIAKFYNGKSCDDETGACTSTTFAQSKAGKIYDLANYIK